MRTEDLRFLLEELKDLNGRIDAAFNTLRTTAQEQDEYTSLEYHLDTAVDRLDNLVDVLDVADEIDADDDDDPSDISDRDIDEWYDGVGL